MTTFDLQVISFFIVVALTPTCVKILAHDKTRGINNVIFCVTGSSVMLLLSFLAKYINDPKLVLLSVSPYLAVIATTFFLALQKDFEEYVSKFALLTVIAYFIFIGGFTYAIV